MQEPAAARPEYRRVVDQYAGAEKYARMAYLRLGDIAREAGDQAEARDFYAKSAALQEEKPPGREALDIAMRVLETEDFLGRGELDAAEEALELWQWQQPTEKLRGQWSVLRMRLAIARQEFDKAIAEGAILLRVNPESQYAPEALYLLAHCCAVQKNRERAEEALTRLKQDYPDSPLIPVAEEAMKTLERKGSGEEAPAPEGSP
jgi:tetratricopeptide (TPR) repeat protein